MTQKFQNANSIVGTFHHLIGPFTGAALKGANSWDIKPIWEGQGGTKGQKFARASCADYFYIITYLKNKIQMLANLIITMKLVSLL